MRVPALLIAVLFGAAAYAQNTINNYKYVVVPTRFSFSKSDNQYDLNTLTKSFLEDKGFVVFMANEQLPPEITTNNCNALNAEIAENNGLLSTKLTLVLKDCRGNIIFKGKEGKSREKDFKTAYTMALTDAFASLKDYKYDGTAAAPVQQQQQPVAAQPASSPVTTPVSTPVTDNAGTLYAQPTPNGYQLVDTTPKKVMTLLKTSMPDYFIVEALKGVVFKKDGWWLEYYKDNKLISQKLEIKF